MATSMEAFLNRTLSETDSPPRGRLDIGCLSSLCRSRLGDEMVAFARRCPDIELGVHEMARASLLLALRAGDIAVAILPEDPQPGLNAVRLWQDKVMLAMPADHRLAGLAQVTPEDIRDDVFIVPRDPHASAMHRFLIGRIPGGEACRSLLLDLNENQLMSEVVAGKGIALVCHAQVAPADAAIIVRPIEAPAAAFWIGAYWREEQPTPALALLLDSFRSSDA